MIMREPPFAGSLLACDDASSLRLAGGNRFIRKLPDDRSLGYLHKLYAPLDRAGLKRMRDAIERRLPEEFEAFLGWSNGASLFDNHVYLFGLVDNLSRSVEPEAQQPISIVDHNRIFSEVKSDRWHGGWTHIGSVVGWNSTYQIELHEEGACALTSVDAVVSVPSFEQCVMTIIGRIDACFSCDGVVDRSYAEIEAALASLIRRQ